MKKYNNIKKPNEGIPCELCGEISELRMHKEITAKLLSQPFYYSKWYHCKNPNCRRTTFMEEKDKVINNNPSAAYYRNKEEMEGQISFFKSL